MPCLLALTTVRSAVLYIIRNIKHYKVRNMCKVSLLSNALYAECGAFPGKHCVLQPQLLPTVGGESWRLRVQASAPGLTGGAPGCAVSASAARKHGSRTPEHGKPWHIHIYPMVSIYVHISPYFHIKYGILYFPEA